MISALDVANTFLDRAKSEDIDITPMKLQKLIYIFYKDYLKETQEKLFDERFETWQYGPVLRSVYNVFKKYRANHIKEFYYFENNKYSTIALPAGSVVKKIFDNVWKTYGMIDGIRLSEMTHQPGTAWYKANINDEPYLEDSNIFQEEPYIA
ncbi:DUF4065 domain-containing protein [Streptococcus sp. LPB0220]|uniref:Panacea domain-containing protein n=1 Tax=Streptococcus sp. LPB0220 TaxID=2610896 RepID=UPI001244B7AC|nr:type II toxin-antitoxin system antitoxin SocA domain-containing protein [Streptococcus sp. LPB0220]QEW10022.1 DUF4065 domain-containing protein [Streptococcus sp. LPB0220]